MATYSARGERRDCRDPHAVEDEIHFLCDALGRNVDVYRARRLSDGALVALKIMRYAYAATNAELARHVTQEGRLSPNAFLEKTRTGTRTEPVSSIAGSHLSLRTFCVR